MNNFADDQIRIEQPLLERINFHQGIAGRAVLAAHNGGVVARA
jgi:hypothetical protein